MSDELFINTVRTNGFCNMTFKGLKSTFSTFLVYYLANTEDFIPVTCFWSSSHCRIFSGGWSGWRCGSSMASTCVLALICNCIQWRRNSLSDVTGHGARGQSRRAKPERDGEIEQEQQTQIKMNKKKRKANGLTLVRGHFWKSSQVIVRKYHFFSVQDTPEMWSVRL